MLSTVAAPQVPYEWVAQTRTNGRVVTPWSSTYKPAGLLSVTIRADGTATGGLLNTTVSFMPLRDQRTTRSARTDVVRDTDTPDVSDTDLHVLTSSTMTRPSRSQYRSLDATGSTSPPR